MDQGLIVALLAVLLLLTGIVIAVLIVMMGRITEVMKKSDFAKLKKEEEENEYEEEIMNIAQEGHEQGVILADEAEMISNIFEFGDKDAKDVMQFRNKIVSLDAGMTVGEAVHFMVEQTYSRYPVCEDDLDHIIGILNFRDAVQAYFEDPGQKVEEISRKPSYVHENMDINELLTQMKEEKNHLVIVVDEVVDGWAWYRYNATRKGYGAASWGYVSDSGLIYPDTVTPVGTAVLAKNGKTGGKAVINVRFRPTTQARKILELPIGTVVDVYGSENGWTEIEWNRWHGFVKDEFIQ